MGSTKSHYVVSQQPVFPFFIENLGYGSTGLGTSFLHLLQNIQIAKSSAKRADEDRGPGVPL